MVRGANTRLGTRFVLFRGKRSRRFARAAMPRQQSGDLRKRDRRRINSFCLLLSAEELFDQVLVGELSGTFLGIVAHSKRNRCR